MKQTLNFPIDYGTLNFQLFPKQVLEDQYFPQVDASLSENIFNDKYFTVEKTRY